MNRAESDHFVLVETEEETWPDPLWAGVAGSVILAVVAVVILIQRRGRLAEYQ